MIEIDKTLDAYHWIVTYHDNSFMGEYDIEDGHAWSDIKSKQVHKILLIPTQQYGVAHGVLVPDGATPVFFRRRSIEIQLSFEEVTPLPHRTVHCIGWKKGDQEVYLFVGDDGSTVLTDNLQLVS